jgi:N-acetylmuramoyl-L-alanine amidase
MILIYDTGHGHNTPGKRSDGFNDAKGNVILKENCVNEAVGNKLSFIHWLNNCEAHFISNEWIDISLSERVRRERKIAKEIEARGEKSLFISIHADAFHVKNKAEGGRFFYYSESGRKIAEKMTKYFRENGYGLSLRDPMYGNFKVIRESASPAILFEMGFMTTKSDLDQLINDDFRNKTANLLYNALQSL